MLFPTRNSNPELYPHRHGLYFAFFHALNWQVVIGTPTVLFMQQLGADAFQVGLVFAWTFLLTPVQVLATAFLPRLGFKRLTLFGWNARAWFLLVPLGLAVLAPTQPASWMITSMILAMFCYNLNRAVGTAALTPWLYQLVPESIRGRYWATDQILAALAGLGILVICALLFALLPPYAAFQVQYLIAIFGALAAYRELRLLPDADKPRLVSLEKILVETPRLLTRPGTFRTYLLQSFPLFIAITPLPPFTAYYLKTVHGTPASAIMLFAMLTYLGVIAANVIMRARLDRFGAKPFFRLSYLAYGISALGWLVFLYSAGRATPLLPFLFFAQGFAGGCWTSANLNYLAQIVPEQDRALPVSLHGAAITFLGGISPVFWGLFLKAPDSDRAVSEPVFAGFFVVIMLVMLTLACTLRHLPDRVRPVAPLMQGAWLLRPLRGLASLINLVEKDPPKDRTDA
ncbi:unnamed protein product [Phaeothamnion confervicola]